MTCAPLVLLLASARARSCAASAALGTDPASVIVLPLNTTRTGSAEPSGSTGVGVAGVVVVEGASVVGTAPVVGTTPVVGTAPVVEVPGAAGADAARPTLSVRAEPPVASATSIAVAPTATAPHAMPAMRRSRRGWLRGVAEGKCDPFSMGMPFRAGATHQARAGWKWRPAGTDGSWGPSSLPAGRPGRRAMGSWRGWRRSGERVVAWRRLGGYPPAPRPMA